MTRIAQWVCGCVAIFLVIVSGNGCSPKMKAAHHLQRAENFMAADKYAPAEIEFKKVLLNDPQNAMAWAGLGQLYFNQGRLLEAAPVLFRASQLDTNDFSVRQKLGFCYLGLGMTGEARKEAETILKSKPQDSQAVILLADTATSTNDIAVIRNQLERLKADGARAPVEVALGNLAFRESDFATAQTCCQRAIKLDSNFADAYTALGMIYIAKKDWKHAGEAFKAAAELASVWSGNGVRYAKFKILSGDPAAGKQMLQDIVKNNPDFLPASIALAESAVGQKHYDEALEQSDNVLRRDPRNLAALEMQSRIHAQQGRNDLMVAGFERLARSYPQMPSIRNELAQAYLANNQTNEAAILLRQTLNAFPQDMGAPLMLAQIELRNGNMSGALSVLRKLVTQHPESVPGWMLLAETYCLQDTPAEAIRIYQSLKQQFPESPRFPLMLGVALRQNGNHEEARVEFEQALQMAPDSIPALDQLVNLELQENKYAAAQKRIDAKLVEHPDQAALYLLRARILAVRGQTNAAEAAIVKAATLQPASPAPHLLLARLHLSTGQYLSAVKDSEEALKRDENNAAAMMLMGMASDSLRNYPQARDTYKTLLKLNPNNTLALNNLAFDYAEHLGRMDLAYPLARRARELAPTDPLVADTYGWILFRLGQPANALPFLRESASQLASNAFAQYHLGMAAYRLGNETEARQAFQKAMRFPVEFPETNDCSDRLKLMDLDVNSYHVTNRTRLEKWVASHPEDPVALIRLARTYQSLNQTNLAAGTYEQVLKITPQNVPALLDYARLLMPSNPQNALRLAQAAYQLKPGDPEVTDMLGRLSYLTGDFQWALILLQLTVQSQPESADARFDLGQAFYAVGKVSEARSVMQQALELSPTNFSRADYAQQFLMLTSPAEHPNDLSAAEARVNQVIDSEPAAVPALALKALLEEKHTNWTEVERIAEKILKHFPDFVPAQRQLALAYAQNPVNDARAYPLALKAHRALPSDVAVARTLGILACRRGNYAQAESLLTDSARRLPQDSELFYYLGLAKYHLKQFKASKASFEQALLLNLPDNRASEVRRLLAAWPAS